jgi:hypothetical protein
MLTDLNEPMGYILNSYVKHLTDYDISLNVRKRTTRDNCTSMMMDG